MKDNKLVEKYDDNPGAYFGMLVENWEELNESVKDKDTVSRILSKEISQPRKFRWLSNNGTSGEVEYNGTKFAFRKLDNGKYKVMTSSEAGSNWSETLFKDESLKEDKFIPQDKMSKKAQKELNDKKRGTWGNTNPVTRVQPNKKAYDRKRDKKALEELLSDSNYKNGERLSIKANKISGKEFDKYPEMAKNVFDAIGNMSFTIDHLISAGSESSTYVIPSIEDIKNLIKNNDDFKYFFRSGQLEFIKDESLEESVLNESSDGWDEDKLEELIELLDRLYDLRYEVTSTIRGAYTNCKTYEELGRYVSELAEGLDSVGTDITLIDEDEEDEEEDLSSYGMESGYYN